MVAARFNSAAGAACAALLWWTASGFDLSRRPALEPEAARALWDRADAARGAGRIDEGLSAVARLLASFPGEPRYLGFQAELFELARRPRDAARSWELYLRVSPTPAEACPALGIDYVAAGEVERGLDADRRCYGLDPSKTDLMVAYALSLERVGRDDEAAPLLREALRRSPEDADAAVILSRLALKKGDLDEAGRIVSAAATLRPADSDVLLAAARVAEARGDLTEARARLEAALRVNPGYADVRRVLARVLDKSGDAEGARRARAAAAESDAEAGR